MNDRLAFGNWISIKDARPRHDERVLVICTNPQNHMQSHVSICTHWLSRNPRGEEFSIWSGFKSVTHWMPLPVIPKLDMTKSG